MVKTKTKIARNAGNTLIIKIDIYLNVISISIRILSLKNNRYI